MISDELQGIISQMLKPLRDIPLNVVVEGLTGHKVIPFNKRSKKDPKVLEVLKRVADEVMQEVNRKGIIKSRPNEVGNAIEPFVVAHLNAVENYEAHTPVAVSGRKKATGYPDIAFTDEFGRLNYLECKTFNIKNIDTAQRSFYLSPSKDFKITADAHHFGMSFEIYHDGNAGDEHIYKIRSWKILDLSKLKLSIKYEFNADNKKLYDKKLILAEK